MARAASDLGTPQEANDFQEPYLRAILGFIGIKDIAIVRAEGLAHGPEQCEAAMQPAEPAFRPRPLIPD
jgi:FMN-dependent NADH-azoreductase